MRSGMICLLVMFGVVVIAASCQKGDWRDVSLKMDQLETDLRHDGLITIKRPDVWTENRLHTYRSEFEEAFRPGPGKPFADFEPNINASSRQVQLERLGLAADIAIAMAGGGGGGQSGPNLAEFLASSLMTNFNTATSLTEQDFFGMLQKGVQGFLQQSTGINPASLAVGQNDQSGNATSGSGGTTTPVTPPPPSNSTQVTNNINPTPRPTSRPAFDFLLGAKAIPEILKLPEAPTIDLLSPFEVQAQKRAFVQQNHLFRIGNEPDDGTRMKGYRLYYMRFMVSVTPSSATQKNYSAEILLSPTYDVLTAARDWVAQYAKAMLHDRLIRTAEVALEIKLRTELRSFWAAVSKSNDDVVKTSTAIVSRSIAEVNSFFAVKSQVDGGPSAEKIENVKEHVQRCRSCVNQLSSVGLISESQTERYKKNFDQLDAYFKILTDEENGPATKKGDRAPPSDETEAQKKVRIAKDKEEALIAEAAREAAEDNSDLSKLNENDLAWKVAAITSGIRTKYISIQSLARIAYREYANEIDYLLGVPNSLVSRGIKESVSLRILRAEAALKTALGRCKCKKEMADDTCEHPEEDCIHKLLFDDALNLDGASIIRKSIRDAMRQLNVVATRSSSWRPGAPRNPLIDPTTSHVNLKGLERGFSPIQDQAARGLTHDERKEWRGWLAKRNLTQEQAKTWIEAYEAGLQAIRKSDQVARQDIENAVDEVLKPDVIKDADRIKNEIMERLTRIAHRPIDFLVKRQDLEYYFSQMEWPIYTFAVAPFSEVENISRAVALNSELELLLNIGLKAGGTLDAETALKYSRQLREQFEAIQVNRTVVGIVRGEQHFGWQINPPFSIPIRRSWLGDRLIFDQASGNKMPSRTHEVFALVAIPGFLRNLNFGVSTEWTCDNRSDGARIGIGKSARYLHRYESIKQNGKAIADVFIKDRLGDRLSLIEASLPLRRMHNVLLPYGDVAERMTNTSGIDLLTPKIYSILPVYLPSHHKIKLVITGKNFDTGRVQVLVSGVEADVVRIANDHTLIAEMSARRFMGNLAAFHKRTLPKTADDKRLHELEGLAIVTVITPVGAASDFTMIRLTAKEVKDTKDKAKAAGPFEGCTIKLNRKTIDLNDAESKRTLILTLSKEVKVQGATITLIAPAGKNKLQPFSANVNGKTVMPQGGAFEKKPPWSKTYPDDIASNPSGTEYGVELTLTFKNSKVTITAADKLKIVY